MKLSVVRGRTEAPVVCALVSQKEAKKLGIPVELREEKPHLMVEGKRIKVLVVVKDHTDPDAARVAAARAMKSLSELKVRQALFRVEGLSRQVFSAMGEGMALGAYSFSRYRAEKASDLLLHADVDEDEFSLISEGLERGEVVNYVRELVNRPGSELTPEALAEEAKRLVPLGVEVRVFDRQRLEEMGMRGILAVGAGSNNPPVFIHAAYRPEKPRARITLVGKGITFDSGGLSIKPPNHMERMKSDKAGACSVLGVLRYAAKKGLPVELHGLMPCAENMPDGGSYRPDDIIVFKNGVSVEIHSTDAEGRLILADALIYAAQLPSDAVIDVATLTGACVVALGRYTSGLFATDPKLKEMLIKAAEKAGEKLWPMPLDEDLEEEIKANHADVRNTGKSRYGGAITAALFLKRFVPEDRPWAHLDVAGPAFLENPWKCYEAGATGQPTGTLIRLLEEMVSEDEA